MKNAQTLADCIAEWLLFCDRNYTASTCYYYRCVVSQMLRSLTQNGNRLSSSAIENFLDGKYRAGGSRGGFNTYRNIICSFCRWRQRKYGIENPANKVPQIRGSSPTPRCLSQEEYKLIVEFTSGMDRDILVWLGNTGLRKSEFARMRWGDIDADCKYIRVAGKGGKHRVVPLNSTCKEILQKYRRGADSELLQLATRYPGSEGSSWLCRKICRKTGVPKFGSHALRHYFSTQLIRKGVSIYKVSRLLGHASVKTTETIYIHLLPIDLLGITDVLD